MDWIWMVLCGCLGGVLGGMGMGGGTLLIPLLTVLCGVEQKLAQAVNLIAFVPMSAFVCVLHAKNKLIEPSQLWLSIPALIASVGASFLALSLDARFLRVGFGIFLSVLGVIQLVTVIIKKVKEKKSENQNKNA